MELSVMYVILNNGHAIKIQAFPNSVAIRPVTGRTNTKNGSGYISQIICLWFTRGHGDAVGIRDRINLTAVAVAGYLVIFVYQKFLFIPLIPDFVQ